MLGHGKISFETPNVIDPGCDQPPSRPARGGRQKMYFDNPVAGADVVVRERPNYTDREDRRELYKPQLTRTIKLNYADDEPNHDDDNNDHSVNHSDAKGSRSSFQELDLENLSAGNLAARAPLSPGMESARLFAATLLAETERRQSQRNLMPGDDDNLYTHRSTRSVPMRWPRRGRRGEFGGLRPTFAPGSSSNGDEFSNDGLFKEQQQVRRRRRCLRRPRPRPV